MDSLAGIRYRLIVVTHGDAPALDRVLTAFDRNVSPAPSERVLVVDGPGRIPDIIQTTAGAEAGSWELWAASRQQGFCETYRRVFAAARATELDYVFLLENDFIVERHVTVGDLAALLIHDQALAQVALVRQACNPAEEQAGGLVEARPGEFTARTLSLVNRQHRYLEHSSFFTTNPCLFRSRLARAHPWPDDIQEHCEGHYGIRLREHGYRFALWGQGEPWVRHVGSRDGFGY